MNEVFFVDLDGNILDDDNISSHIGLAKKIVGSNIRLLKEFQNSNYKREDMFLIMEKGYCAASNEYNNRFLLINKEKSTKKQKEVLYRFVQDGYSFYFTDDEEEKSKTF